EEDRGAGEPVLRGEGAEKKKVVAGADFVSGEVRDDENRTRRGHPRSCPSRSARPEDFGGNDRHERDHRHGQINRESHVARGKRVIGTVRDSPERSEKSAAERIQPERKPGNRLREKRSTLYPPHCIGESEEKDDELD